MILREQLKELRGKYIKVGSRMAFWYCQICDDNIEKVLDKLSKKEHKRITTKLEQTTTELNNFEEIWKKRVARTISRKKGGHKRIIEDHVKKDIKYYLAELKEKGIKLKKDEKKELIEQLTKEYTKKYKKEFGKEHNKQLRELKTIILPHKKEEYYTKLTNKYNQYTKLVKNFKPYLERKVKEVYNSIVDENTVIVKVTGYEEGKYWDQEEYDKENNPYKVGDKIRIIEMKDEPQYSGREGVIKFIDSLGQLHGTWGGLAVILRTDKIERCSND